MGLRWGYGGATVGLRCGYVGYELRDPAVAPAVADDAELEFACWLGRLGGWGGLLGGQEARAEAEAAAATAPPRNRRRVKLVPVPAETGRNLFLARPPGIDAAPVRENWLSVSFITDASCHRWRRMSTPYPHAPKVSIARKTCTCTGKALRWQPTAWHSTVLPTLGLPGRAAAGYPRRNRVRGEWPLVKAAIIAATAFPVAAAVGDFYEATARLIE